MSEIKLNQEVITALENCKDVKAVVALAKSKGIELSEEQAGKIFNIVHNEKLTDEQLEEVVGGGNGCGDNWCSPAWQCSQNECEHYCPLVNA